jgi:VanZ family protein
LDPKTLLVLALAYTTAILVLSLIKMDKISMPNFSQSDKYAHALAYTVLALVWYAYYYCKETWRSFQIKPLIVICLLVVVFGIFIEVLQGTLTNYRTIDAWDVLANSVGATLAFFIIFSIKNTLENVKTKL